MLLAQVKQIVDIYLVPLNLPSLDLSELDIHMSQGPLKPPLQ